MPVTMPITLSEGEANVTLDIAIYYCEAVQESLCFPFVVRFVVPVKVAASTTERDSNLAYTIVPPLNQ